MKKSIWIEVVEWCVLVVVTLLLVGVVAKRGEIISPDPTGSTAPIGNLDD
jgi:hypothetical protein